jgi:hypothetical protein
LFGRRICVDSLSKSVAGVLSPALAT